jgi:hypothetical protein
MHAWNLKRCREVQSTMLQNVPHHGKIRRHRDGKQLAMDALATGTAASLASAAALMLGSKLSGGNAVAGLNGPSQWLWGEAEAYTREPTWRHTATGYAIHHATSVFWAVVHEKVFGGSRARKPALRHLAEAAVSASTAYFVDYHLTPRRFQPGFEKHVSSKGMVAVYAAFAIGLAVTAIARDRQR